jgi:hypothetical protein
MATYPNVNAANQYARDVVGGKILASVNHSFLQRHLDDLERSKDPHWPYRFDKNKAERFLRFPRKCLIPLANGRGENCVLSLNPGSNFRWVCRSAGYTKRPGYGVSLRFISRFPAKTEICDSGGRRKLYVLR